MVDTYAGESMGKKRARFGFWAEVKATQGDYFFTRKHLVLASREGGDISVLVGMGVPISNIVAVDREESAAAACRLKWPGCDVICGDVCDAANYFKDDLQTVFLDFCGPVTVETIRTCVECFRVMPCGPSVVLAAAFLKGRERRQTPKVSVLHAGSGFNRRARLRRRSTLRHLDYASKINAILEGRENCDPMDLMESIANDSGAWDAGAMRMNLLDGVFELASNYREAEAIRVINYQGKGVPMCILVFAVRKKGFTSRNHEFTITFVGDPNSRSAREYQSMTKGVPVDMEKSPVLWVKEFCVNEPDSDYASLVLNIPRSTISAWKAHSTRGTYGQTGT